MNKKQRKEALRQLIDDQMYEERFDEAATVQMNTLTGWDFPLYKRVFNDDWPKDTRCVAHSVNGQEWEVWSWNKAVDGYVPDKNIIEALRLAIQPQMRRYALLAEDHCAVCSATDFLTVDHKDVPFIVMARRFMKDNHALHKAIKNDASGVGWYISNEEVKETWVLHHKLNATYQILCRSCNSKKGATYDASERQA